jgi:hypothetical protein
MLNCQRRFCSVVIRYVIHTRAYYAKAVRNRNVRFDPLSFRFRCSMLNMLWSKRHYPSVIHNANWIFKENLTLSIVGVDAIGGLKLSNERSLAHSRGSHDGHPVRGCRGALRAAIRGLSGASVAPRTVPRNRS